MEKETKVCKVCGKELPIDQFRKTNLGVTNTCNDCIRRKISHARLEKKLAAINKNDVEAAKTARLQDFTPRELLAELKKRGYRWTKMEVTITQEVDWSKI